MFSLESHTAKDCVVHSILILAVLITCGMIMPASSTEEGDWKTFRFDISSESWKREGKNSFDLREEQYATSGYARTHEGNFLTVTGFYPKWAMLVTMEREKILFSSDTANDTDVDRAAQRVPNCVAVHYGGAYVATFDDRTYTIKLMEADFKSGNSYVQFAYHHGGVPVPEHQPLRTPSARDASESELEDAFEMRSETEAEGEIDASRGALRMRIQEKDSGVILGTPDPLPAEQGDAGDGAPDIDRRARFRRIAPSSAKRSAGWIHNLNIIATAPTAENSAVEESDFKVQLDGPARFFSVYYGVRPGTTRIFTFRNIPAGKYEMQVAYGNEMINDNFSIEEPGDDEFIEIEIEF